MKKSGMFAVVASVAVAAIVSTGGRQAGADAPLEDGLPSQADLDNVSGTSSVSSRWDQSQSGVAKRPYIKRLSVTNGGTETVLITNETGPGTPTVVSPYNVTGTIAGYNICAQGVTTGCYADPNRVSFALVYKDVSAGGTNYRRNFAADASPAPTTGPNPAVTASSVIDVTIALNSLGSSLGWSWLNGTPVFWQTEGLGTDNGTVRLKYKPATMPQPNGCTAIPVSTCDVNNVANEYLMTEMILSLDTTLPKAFKGALFATEGAFIGSLDVVPGGNGKAPQLTYGIAAPKYVGAGTTTERRGTFYGILDDTVLKNEFGVESTATDADMAKVLDISRKTDTTKRGSDTVAWTKWSAAANGTAGRMVKISDISFSAPKFVVTGAAVTTTTTVAPTTITTTVPATTTVAPTTTAPAPTVPTVKAGRTITRSAIGKAAGVSIPAGAKVTLVVATSSKKICRLSGTAVKGLKAGTCRVTVSVTPKATKSSPKPKTTRKAVSITVS